MITSRLRSIVLVVLATLLTVGFVAAPANAAARTKVFIKGPSSVCSDVSFRVEGKVSGKSAGAKVRLQTYSKGKWVTVKKGKVSSARKYSLTVKPVTADTKYRAVVSKTKKIRSAKSRTLVVRASTGGGCNSHDCPPGQQWSPGGGPLNLEPGCYGGVG
jgi:hypothetical protein